MVKYEIDNKRKKPAAKFPVDSNGGVVQSA
jgi:hypothetical protein